MKNDEPEFYLLRIRVAVEKGDRAEAEKWAARVAKLRAGEPVKKLPMRAGSHPTFSG
jgi:hypothetical protein